VAGVWGESNIVTPGDSDLGGKTMASSHDASQVCDWPVTPV